MVAAFYKYSRGRKIHEHIHNTSFNVSLFKTGKPSGGNNYNLLFWDDSAKGGAEDASASYNFIYSLCEHSKQPRRLKTRGLCSSSLIDNEYQASTHPDGKTIVWFGGISSAIIQYDNESSGLILKSLGNMAYAQINLSNSADLIGKHEWTIFNDTGCSTEFSYSRNVSLRLIYYTKN